MLRDVICSYIYVELGAWGIDQGRVQEFSTNMMKIYSMQASKSNTIYYIFKNNNRQAE